MDFYELNNRKPRQGWAESFKVMHQREDDDLIIQDSLDLLVEDWQWELPVD